MKKLISLVAIFLCISTVYGQYVEDALRYSQNFPTLTARSMAMGGAFTSLGGDYSSAFINPAGLGLFRKSEFHFSPGLGYSNTDASYKGQTNNDNKYQVSLSSIGYVGNYSPNKEKGLVGFTYAIGYNRLNNYSNNIFIRGNNNSSSYSDYFVESANGNTPGELNPFYEGLAYDAWVIDTVGSIDNYGSLVPVPIEQNKYIQTKGGVGEWSLAFGMNFSNIVYWGMGLGINQLHYEQGTLFSEYNDDNGYVFRSFDFTEDLDVRGSGISFRTGIIVRALKSLRIGAALQLPTFYTIDETYFTSIYSEFDDSSFYYEPINSEGEPIEEGVFSYKLNTPLKLKGGVSVQIGKSGIISGDLEYVNYSSMKLKTHADFDTRDDRDYINDVNSEIDETYVSSVINLKLGGEIRLSNFAIRAGYGYYPSPFENNGINKKASYSEITSGLGYRDNNVFIDLAFSGLFHKENYNLYTSNSTDNIANLKQQKYRFVATVGFRF